VRHKRLAALTKDVKMLRAVPMDKKGITRENDLLQGFNLKLMQVSQYVWEFSESADDF
jgi:phage terminase large subunit-like protein